MNYKIIYICIACLLNIAIGFAQQSGTLITGKVTEGDTGEPLMMAYVAELDAANRVVSGSSTDMNGEFAFMAKNPKNRLQVSFIGFKTIYEEIGKKRHFEFKLGEDTKTLQEAVVVAQKTMNGGGLMISKREMSMAMTSISTKEIEGISTVSIDDALQGRISGLDIVGASGAPGSGSSMRIRGTNSITGSSEPLIVVNGTPFSGDINEGFDFANADQEQFADLLNVNVDDIEEITVLKDAASTAMWGSKGANGVLLIKTKRGAKGKTRVNYTYRMTRAEMPDGMEMLNGDNYTMLMKQAYFNKTKTVDDLKNLLSFKEFNYDPSFSEYYNFNRNTDWVEEVKQTGWTNDHYLSVAGGGERAAFRVGLGYYEQTGTNIGQELKRISNRSNLDYQVSDRLLFQAEFAFTYSDNDRNYEDLLNIAYKKMPNVSVMGYDAQGNYTGNYYNIRNDSELHSDQKNLKNPVALAYLATNNVKSYRVIPKFNIQYDILDPNKNFLRYKGSVNFDLNNEVTSKFLPSECTNYSWANSSVNRAEQLNAEKLTVNTDNNITFKKIFEEIHSLMLYGSLQTTVSNTTKTGYVSYGNPSEDINSPTAGGYLSSESTESVNGRYMGVLFSGHYAYKGKYIADFTYRMDGSTQFGKTYRYGSFPGVGAKWIISDEKFFKFAEEWLSLLAFRPSWGVSGKQPGAEYLHYSLYSADSYGYMGNTAIFPSRLQLTDLRWEKVTSTNLGIDLDLLQGRISTQFDYYHKRTTDLLFKNLAISPTSGFSTISYKNVGSMDNDGWELSINCPNVVKSGRFSMDVNFNISQNQNKIISLNSSVMDTYNQAGSTIGNGVYLTRIQENNPFGSIYGFRYKGVYQHNEYDAEKGHTNAPVARDAKGNVMTDYEGNIKPMYYRYGSSAQYKFKGGDVIYEDINNDGSIDEYDVVYLGSSNPKFTGGFGINLRYRGFSVNSFFNFRYGNKIINYARMEAENMYNNNNQTVTTNHRWRKDGDITDVPRAVYQEGYNWLGSDRYVEDGSFLRFKQLTFRYAVPSAKLKPYGLSSLNMYWTFNNLLCITKYSGADPEISQGTFTYGMPGVSKDTSRTPRSKDWTIGVSVGF